MPIASRRHLAPLRVGVIALVATACTRRDPPAPDASPWLAVPEWPSAPPAPSPPAARPAASAAVAALPAPAAPAVAPSSVPSATPRPSPLTQTHDLPASTGAPFEARASLLWQAIVRDDADLAMPFFFPLGAYEQVKDVGDPAADWNRRLVAAFRNDIHALHGRLGPGADRATLASLDVPEAGARWVEPGEEWNKVGYYRVFGSKLRYDADGERHAFVVKSLISWRGEWFVVHLVAVR